MFEWEAFGALSTDRPVGFARGAIPWSSIDRYAQRYGLDDDDFGRFQRLIRAMDAAYLDHCRKLDDAERKALARSGGT